MAANTKEKVLIAFTGAMLIGGLAKAYQPPSSDTARRQAEQTQQQVDALREAQERENERKRAAGAAHLDAENMRARTPVEPRPAEPRVRLRFIP